VRRRARAPCWGASAPCAAAQSSRSGPIFSLHRQRRRPWAKIPRRRAAPRTGRRVTAVAPRGGTPRVTRGPTRQLARLLHRPPPRRAAAALAATSTAALVAAGPACAGCVARLCPPRVGPRWSAAPRTWTARPARAGTGGAGAAAARPQARSGRAGRVRSRPSYCAPVPRCDGGRRGARQRARRCSYRLCQVGRTWLHEQGRC